MKQQIEKLTISVKSVVGTMVLIGWALGMFVAWPPAAHSENPTGTSGAQSVTGTTIVMAEDPAMSAPVTTPGNAGRPVQRSTSDAGFIPNGSNAIVTGAAPITGDGMPPTEIAKGRVVSLNEANGEIFFQNDASTVMQRVTVEPSAIGSLKLKSGDRVKLSLRADRAETVERIS